MLEDGKIRSVLARAIEDFLGEAPAAVVRVHFKHGLRAVVRRAALRAIEIGADLLIYQDLEALKSAVRAASPRSASLTRWRDSPTWSASPRDAELKGIKPDYPAT